MKILQLSVHFSPNVGGVETHLWDLVTLLSKKGWKVFVLCYQPLSIKVPWKMIEKNKNLGILRIPWITGLFYKLIPYKKLEFLYLFPGIFIVTPFVLILENPQIIHAHGLVAGFVATFWGKVFRKKVIISTHSLYSFPSLGFYREFVKFIFNNSDKILCLSKKSCGEIAKLGVSKNKIIQFTYWLDLHKFKKLENAKDLFGFREKFIVLFVGRLVSEKGIDVLLDSSRHWNSNIGLVFAGTGPLEEKIKKQSAKDFRIHFLGRLSQDQLPAIYSAADITIMPSVSEEGFGRVIMESLACSTPVLAANRGSIPEALDASVGRLIDISPDNIKVTVEDLYKDVAALRTLAGNARKFAERRYSNKNADSIIRTYTQ